MQDKTAADLEREWFRRALETIAGGDGNAADIAAQTLEAADLGLLPEWEAAKAPLSNSGSPA